MVADFDAAGGDCGDPREAGGGPDVVGNGDAHAVEWRRDLLSQRREGGRGDAEPRDDRLHQPGPRRARTGMSFSEGGWGAGCRRDVVCVSCTALWHCACDEACDKACWIQADLAMAGVKYYSRSLTDNEVEEMYRGGQVGHGVGCRWRDAAQALNPVPHPNSLPQT
eukprot:1088719-Rhodomonas_salina.2